MNIALYKGKSLVSSAIRFFTRSDYSHAAFVFDEHAAKVAYQMSCDTQFHKLHYWHVGAVVEAWQGGVQNSMNMSSLHTRGTEVEVYELVCPLIETEERALVGFLEGAIGEPYSFLNVFRFLTRRPGSEDGSWFCSELCFEGLRQARRSLLVRTEAWEVPPGWLQRSPLVRYVKTVMTN